jgi:DNA repair protein RadC
VDLADAPLSDATLTELVSLVLRSKRPLVNVMDRVGGLEALGRCGAFEIAAYLEGRDPDVPSAARIPLPQALAKGRALAAAFELGRRLEIERARTSAPITTPADVARWASPRLAALTHEELWVLALDGRGHLRAARCIAKGGLHGASVQASQPLRAALRADASAFVLVHNHPSGDPTPSDEDIVFTEHVDAAARIAGIALLDHVVVAKDGFACVPFAENASTRIADGSAR